MQKVQSLYYKALQAIKVQMGYKQLKKVSTLFSSTFPSLSFYNPYSLKNDRILSSYKLDQIPFNFHFDSGIYAS